MLVHNWIDALRSGEFRQGNCDLFGRDEQNNKVYDVFGVLGVIGEKSLNYNLESCVENYLDAGGFGFYLPDALENKVNILDEVRERLIDMGDKEGKTFEQMSYYIADMILEGKITEVE